MEVKVYLKGKKEPVIFKGDRVDLLDITLQGIEYKQIRFFRKGFSKSEYIDKRIITKIE